MDAQAEVDRRLREFISKDGKHETIIDEVMNPAVIHETYVRRGHEQKQQAIDRTIHQDHFHTSVQEVRDDKTLPVQHDVNFAAATHRSIEHDDAEQLKLRLAAEASQYKNERFDVQEERTSSVQPTVTGEHVVHHVHEVIQPILKRTTIEPHVVYNVETIHETIHNAAQHHTATELPSITLDEFMRQGGSLEGRKKMVDGFEGVPRENYGAEVLTTSSRTTTSGNLGASATGAAQSLGSSTSSYDSLEDHRNAVIASSAGNIQSVDSSNITNSALGSSNAKSSDARASLGTSGGNLSNGATNVGNNVRSNVSSATNNASSTAGQSTTLPTYKHHVPGSFHSSEPSVGYSSSNISTAPLASRQVGVTASNPIDASLQSRTVQGSGSLGSSYSHLPPNVSNVDSNHGRSLTNPQASSHESRYADSAPSTAAGAGGGNLNRGITGATTAAAGAAGGVVGGAGNLTRRILDKVTPKKDTDSDGKH